MLYQPPTRLVEVFQFETYPFRRDDLIQKAGHTCPLE